MHLLWPQITYIVINALGLGIILNNHGKPKNEKYNFFLTFFVLMFELFILASGGFFG